MSYKHLSFAERYYIEIECKAGTSMNQLAKALGVPKALYHGRLAVIQDKRGYRHKQANRLAEQRHKQKPKAVKLTDDIKQLITGYVKQDWSPEQIAGWFERRGDDQAPS